jgi:hypothetical protein
VADDALTDAAATGLRALLRREVGATFIRSSPKAHGTPAATTVALHRATARTKEDA